MAFGKRLLSAAMRAALRNALQKARAANMARPFNSRLHGRGPGGRFISMPDLQPAAAAQRTKAVAQAVEHTASRAARRNPVLGQFEPTQFEDGRWNMPEKTRIKVQAVLDRLGRQKLQGEKETRDR